MEKELTPEIPQTNCPVPITGYDKILLSHGGGGRLTQQLIEKIFYTKFENELLLQRHDGAVFTEAGASFAFTTDSYVISPVFFPGGDIGTLSVNGTVNDLAMCGAKPLYISAGFILEEGFPVSDLLKVAESMSAASEKAGVKIITGDTKVVERGKGDKIYINTSGIGIVEEGVSISPCNIRAGDVIILSGSIAEHGIAILSAREGLKFITTIKSDTAPLNILIRDIWGITKNIHFMRDPTRGGVAGVLNEIAQVTGLGIEIEESKIKVKDEVNAACEILGFDPLYIANEGKALIFAAKEDAVKILKKIRSNPLGAEAGIIGSVVKKHPSTVVLKTIIGTSRVIDMPAGEQLPRIC
ncbi:MAG: hydrogenase expression/formation protein HypE [Bacillota bacterium]